MLDFCKVKPLEIGIRFIVENCLHESASEPETKEHIIKGLINGTLELWCFPDRGFAVLNIEHTRKGNRLENRCLYVHCLEGKNIVNRDGIESVEQLAINEGCETIQFQTKNDRLMKVLERFGFEVAFEDASGFKHIFKGLSKWAVQNHQRKQVR